METYTRSLVPGQVPEFVKTDYPRFVEFMETYYRFLEGYNLDITSLRDPDLTADNLIRFLKDEFAGKFPKARVNDRKLTKLIRQIYDSKGTTNAIDLLFRLFFNEAIVVYQPNASMLRASDGRWVQENSITLETRFLDQNYTLDDKSEVPLRVVNEEGTFFISTDRIINLGGNRYQFFFKSFREVPFESDQTIDINADDGSLLYRGVLVRTPSRLEILNPGKFWKVGQIINIPGTVLPTLAIVSETGPNGEVLKTRIVEYGLGHIEDQIDTVSPFPNKPADSVFDIESEIVGFNPFTEEFIFNYTLTIADGTDGMGEQIRGVSDILDDGNYHTTYAEQGWSGQEEFFQSITPSVSGGDGSLIDDTLTIAQWLESQTTFRYVFEQEVRYPGFFQGVEGQLSSPEVRLQDNYFYQLFSYVVETTVGISEYRNALNMIHPAGLKFFGDLAKLAIITVGDREIGKTVTKDDFFRNSRAQVLTLKPVMDMIKILSTIAPITDPDAKVITRGTEFRTVTATDSVAKVIQPFKTEEVIGSALITSKQITKVNSSPLTIDDPLQKIMSRPASSSALPEDAVGIGINKLPTESISLEDAGENFQLFDYTGGTYWEATYNTTEQLLNLG